MNDFHGFDALSFDCYGTLIDWETGIRKALAVWSGGRGVEIGGDDLLMAFANHETTVQSEQPQMLYPAVLAESLRRIAAEFNSEASLDDCVAFGSSVARWPAFDDSVDALRRLKERYKLIILSNVDRQSFAASNARLGVEFDLIVTAEDVGAYKPSGNSFPALLSQIGAIGVEQCQLLHVAQSLFHNHEPAHVVGLPSVWIDRRRGLNGYGATPAPRSVMAQPRWQYPSMDAFATDALTPSA